MMEGLGRAFNVAPVAAGTLISLKDASGITFIVTGADTFTVKSALTYNGTATALPAIQRYYKCTSTAGGAAWTDSGDLTTPVSALTLTSGAGAFFIDASDLPAGAEYVEVTAAASGLVVAITHDLLIQRGPVNMRQLSGSAS